MTSNNSKKASGLPWFRPGYLALALGVIESFGAAYISAIYKDGFSFLVLILFLLLRPQGIFGEKVAEKA